MTLKLHQKLSIGIFTIVFFMMIAMYSIANRSITQSITSKITNDLKKAKDLFAFFEDSRYKQLLIENLIITEIPQLKTVVTTPDVDKATILDTASQLNQVIRSDLFVLTGADGKLLASINGHKDYQYEAQINPALKRALQGHTFQGLLVIDKKIYQTVANPFLYGDEVVGTLLTGYLVDQALLNHFAEMTSSEIALLTESESIISSKANAQLKSLREAIIQSDWTEGVFIKDLSGEKYLLLEIPLNNTADFKGYYLLARSLDHELLFYGNIKKYLLILSVIILLISLTFANLFSRRITRPVNELVKATKKIAGGEFHSKVKIHSADEIGDLAQSFNAMAKSLTEHIDVEKKIAATAITAEIDRARAESLESQREELEHEIMERKETELKLEKKSNELEQAVHDLKNNELALRAMYGDLQNMNKKLSETQMQLYQAERLETVGRLASGVAHEVKNPLMMIQLNLDYIGNKISKNDKNMQTALSNSIVAVERADAVIKGLLDFSRVSDLNMKISNINLVVERSLFMVKHQFLTKKITVKKNLADNIPDSELDEVKVEQIFVNLLVNSVHAMQTGGKIKVKTFLKTVTKEDNVGNRKEDKIKVGDNAVFVELEDNGPGIPEELLHKVFDPFFTTKGEKEGTGLGLSIIKSIAELHHGAIFLENKKEGGVRARVLFKVN